MLSSFYLPDSTVGKMNLNGVVSMWKVRELVDKATNIVMNYTETEAKVRPRLKSSSLIFCLNTTPGHLACTELGDQVRPASN